MSSTSCTWIFGASRLNNEASDGISISAKKSEPATLKLRCGIQRVEFPGSREQVEQFIQVAPQRDIERFGVIGRHQPLPLANKQGIIQSLPQPLQGGGYRRLR